MSAIEVDLIQFTTGPRQGEHAVMVDYAFQIAVFNRDGEAIIHWDGNDLLLDRSEWTTEIECVNEWIEANGWKFVDATSDELTSFVQQIASLFCDIKSVVIGTYAPHQAASEPGR